MILNKSHTMSIGKRLRKALEDKGLTNYSLHQGTKISQSTIGRIVKDENTPNRSTIVTISNYLGLNPDWLESEKGEMYASNEPNGSNGSNKSLNDIEFTSTAIYLDNLNIMEVPLISQRAWGSYLNGFGDPEYFENLPKIPWESDVERKGEYVCFEVKGDSMDDGSSEAYLEGDILLCRSVRQDYWKSKLHIHKWDFVIVHKEKGVVVKRIIKHDVENGIITLHSLNDEYDDYEVHLKDVAQIFNIVDFKRRPRSRR